MSEEQKEKEPKECNFVFRLKSGNKKCILGEKCVGKCEYEGMPKRKNNKKPQPKKD